MRHSTQTMSTCHQEDTGERIEGANGVVVGDKRLGREKVLVGCSHPTCTDVGS
jgi:hypothetical protein